MKTLPTAIQGQVIILLELMNYNVQALLNSYSDI